MKQPVVKTLFAVEAADARREGRGVVVARTTRALLCQSQVESGYGTMPNLPGIGFEDKDDLYRVMKALAD